MSVYKPKGSPFFHYDFQFRGERFHGSTCTAARREAEQVERLKRKDVRDAAGIADKASGKAGPRDMPFGVACERYYQEKGKNAASAEEIDTNLERLVSWLGETTPLTEIDDSILATLVKKRGQDYRWGKKKLGFISNRQVNYSVTLLLKRIMIRARDVWKIPLPDMPHWKKHLLPETSAVREVRIDEEMKLEAVENADYRPARLFAQATGLRRREVVDLRKDQIHWAEGYIEVMGKGNKRHRIPITPEIRDILKPLLDHHPTHVFTYVCQRSRRCPKSKRYYVKGKRYPITYWGWGTRVKRDVAAAGLKGVTIHKFRHTAGSRITRAYGIEAAQRLLNHSSLTTTRKHYADTSLDDLAEAMAARSADEAARREIIEADMKSRKSPETEEENHAKPKRNKR